MKYRLIGLIWAVIFVLSVAAIFDAGYRSGKRAGAIETEKYWIEAVVSRHLGYLVKQEGRETFIEFRYVPKVRRAPVIHLDENGKEINKGGGLK